MLDQPQHHHQSLDVICTFSFARKVLLRECLGTFSLGRLHCRRLLLLRARRLQQALHRLGLQLLLCSSASCLLGEGWPGALLLPARQAVSADNDLDFDAATSTHLSERARACTSPFLFYLAFWRCMGVTKAKCCSRSINSR